MLPFSPLTYIFVFYLIIINFSMTPNEAEEMLLRKFENILLLNSFVYSLYERQLIKVRSCIINLDFVAGLSNFTRFC